MARRFLFVGLGSAGQRHARNLRALLGDEAELLAVRTTRNVPLIDASMQAVPGGDVEAAYGIHPFDDLAAALAERPEAVFVTNPASHHLPVAQAAVEAGAHVFVEKPLAASLDGVDALVDAAERARVVGLVGFQLRFHPGLRLVRQLLDEGAIGRLLAARFAFGEWVPGYHPWEDYRDGNTARRDLGGGVILAQSHELDVALALFGRPGRVFAAGGRRSSLDLAVEDTASIVLDVDGLPVHLHMDLVQRPPLRSYQVLGEDGRIDWDYFGNTVTVTRTDGSSEVTGFPGFERNSLFVDELRHFLACIAGSETPLVDLRAGADSLRVALAARRSLETGDAVRIA